MNYPTVEWRGSVATGVVRLIDQTLLPGRLKFVRCTDVKQVWEALRMLRVRGAPAIGVGAAYGLVLAVRGSRATTAERFLADVERQAAYLASARPTAVNLFWALDRMRRVAREEQGLAVPALKARLLAEAETMAAEDRATSIKMAEHGLSLMRGVSTVLTHCNTGGLATAQHGTALSIVYRAQEIGKPLKVYATETRPLLQGARLTAWELTQAGIDVTLICDSAAATVMRQERVDCVILGADRIAANGDTANKIGTYALAVLAREHGIPFYVVAPLSSFDPEIASGDEIPIEERSGEEITCPYGLRIAPAGVRTYNPAFDVTPAKFITAIVTEYGVLHPPYNRSIQRSFKDRAAT
ncbi:MAG: S-methyl-5-thioribose-1-phosphate isomerase [Planctomycetes bacterium]|nr:S-methyl-5-thioribose-1-phosphate isomerase [Planctomycetota bacterium]